MPRHYLCRGVLGKGSFGGTYDNLEPVQKRGRICQAAKLKLGRVVLWHVSIRAGAEVHLLDVAEERVAQVLHGVDKHTAIDGIPCEAKGGE